MPDDAVLERSRAFDPASLSAREARDFVRALLVEAGHEEWVDSAELAVSEVVTNVVLHAHTGFDLTVRLADDHVRVEVRDQNPALPQQRSYDDEATTGRGMALVEAVTDAHGVTPLGPDGKVVWFCVGARPVDGAEDLLDAWDDSGWDVPEDPPPPSSSTTTVRLLGLPPTTWLAAREHDDALLREYALHRAEHPDPGVSDDDLARADAARALLNAALEGLLARATLADEPPHPLPPLPSAVDLDLEVPDHSAAAFGTLEAVLRAADRLAVTDALLASPAQPELVALREWACRQVVAQLSGGAPAPWAAP